MYITDQIVRGGDVVDSDSSISRIYDYNMLRVDAHNQEILRSILDKYGWLHDSTLSYRASSAQFLVLQHSPNEMMLKYFPMFKATVGMRSSVAMMEDRILMRQGKKQIYGTQATSILRDDGSMAIWPIENHENVEERRQGLFSQTVKEYADFMGVEYDPCEALPANNPWVN
jgi:hypothetical protein